MPKAEPDPAGRATATMTAPEPPARTAWLPAAYQPGPAEPQKPRHPPANGHPAIGFDTAHRAAYAYCHELCDPVTASRAADEAVASWTARDRAGAADALSLLAITREVAARHATRAARPGLRGVLGAEHETDCDSTLPRLADAASGRLSDRDRRAFDAHMSGCLRCQATALKAERAERAFRAKLNSGDEAAPSAAAAVAAAAAPEPVPAALTPAPLPPEPAAAAGESAWALPAVAAAPAADAALAPEAEATTTLEATPPRTPANRRRRLVAGALALVAALGVAAAAVALIGHSSKRSDTAASRKPAAPAAAVVTHSARSLKHRAAKSHRRAVVHRAHARKAPQQPAATVASTSQPTNTGSAPVASSPPVTSAPAAPVTPAAPVAPSSPPPTSSGPSVSIQGGGGLPAQNAPTQGIGSGGSSGSKH